ncbi:potassium channel family protein [Paenibacillus sp. TRM 82003]|uniref:potassium channel family protein n=1 Tax=Kineococcus sp. TRM81007 TaxID=2925831 RepID=UPI001F5678F2|nr:potassium channel family protein [Kineococcus sp. TRM81007]MCI2237577.1 potassium channel family protein [Kineococcus sp. TRM81007]MCI3921851.1 potassium channel family protein [Paenibacillus sp. TRM 82003]
MSTPVTSPRDARYQAYEHVGERVAPVVAALWLIAYSLPILQPELPGAVRTACHVVRTGVWAAFGVDYLVRLGLSGHRLRFLVTHPLDLLLLLLPMLQPLRLLRIVTVLRLLNQRAGTRLRGQVSLYVTVSTVLIGFCAACAVLEAERGAPGATIATFGEAVWWVVTTITTVGYGDFAPVTATGRAVAVGLMLAGIALVGVVTGSLASWFLDEVRDSSGEDAEATRADVAELADEVRRLREQLAARGTAGS